MLTIAHRGYSAVAPENTCAAFRLAVESGVEAMECDVHLSKDGVPVVIHDNTVNRTTDGRWEVHAFTWEELQRLDAGGWMDPRFAGERIPSLAQVLEIARGRVTLCIELKAPGTAEPVVKLLDRYSMRDQVIIFSFFEELLREVAARAPEVPRLLLVWLVPGINIGETQRLSRWALNLGVQYLGINHEVLTEKRISGIQEAGLQVFTYTVNDEKRMQKLIGWGVDGLISDDAGKLLRVCQAS